MWSDIDEIWLKISAIVEIGEKKLLKAIKKDLWICEHKTQKQQFIL